MALALWKRGNSSIYGVTITAYLREVNLRDNKLCILYCTGNKLMYSFLVPVTGHYNYSTLNGYIHAARWY